MQAARPTPLAKTTLLPLRPNHAKREALARDAIMLLYALWNELFISPTPPLTVRARTHIEHFHDTIIIIDLCVSIDCLNVFSTSKDFGTLHSWQV